MKPDAAITSVLESVSRGGSASRLALESLLKLRSTLAILKDQGRSSRELEDLRMRGLEAINADLTAARQEQAASLKATVQEAQRVADLEAKRSRPERQAALADYQLRLSAMAPDELAALVREAIQRPETLDPGTADALSAAAKATDATAHVVLRERLNDIRYAEVWRRLPGAQDASDDLRWLTGASPETILAKGADGRRAGVSLTGLDGLLDSVEAPHG